MNETFVRTNINCWVKAKLTSYGRQIFYNHYEDLYKDYKDCEKRVRESIDFSKQMLKDFIHSRYMNLCLYLVRK